MAEEIKTEISKEEPQKLDVGSPKHETSVTPPADFKVAEIWIRSGQLMLDATPEFWKDKFRARGLLAYLDDIVRDAKVPEEKKKIIPAKGSFLNGLRNLKIRRN